MVDLIIISVTQILFSVFRNLNFIYLSKGKIFMTAFTSLLLKAVILYSTFVGVEAIINKDYVKISVYIISGVVGDLLTFKLKIK